MEISGARRGPDAAAAERAGTGVIGARRRGGAAKRAFDIVVGSMALILLAPVFVVLAVSIKATSRGPVFYRQERMGRRGREFRIWKFRTMVAGADRLGPKVSPGDDPRITRVGAVLRK